MRRLLPIFALLAWIPIVHAQGALISSDASAAALVAVDLASAENCGSTKTPHASRKLIEVRAVWCAIKSETRTERFGEFEWRSPLGMGDNNCVVARDARRYQRCLKRLEAAGLALKLADHRWITISERPVQFPLGSGEQAVPKNERFGDVALFSREFLHLVCHPTLQPNGKIILDVNLEVSGPFTHTWTHRTRWQGNASYRVSASGELRNRQTLVVVMPKVVSTTPRWLTAVKEWPVVGEYLAHELSAFERSNDLLLLLTVRLVDEDSSKERSAEQEPSYHGKPTSYWRAKLRTRDADGFPLPCGNQPLFGAEDPAAIPVLVRLVRDEDAGIRATAAHSLSTMGRELDGVVPALVNALKDPEMIVRDSAALALAKVDPVKHNTVPLLIAALDDKEVCVRIAAAEALGTLGPSAMAATRALARALRDEDSYVRVKSAEALYKIDRRVNVVVPILVRGLKDENVNRRRGAAEALKGMGPDAKAAVTALTEALMDDVLMFDASQALGAIGPDAKPATPALLKIVNERRAAGQPFWWARDALVRIDPKALDLAGVPEDR